MPTDAVTEDSLEDALREADDDSDSPSAAHILAAVEGRLFSIATDDPRQLGRYRIIERLGSGGMGVVFRAHDPELSRDVAIKQVHRHNARSAAARARLRQEARALADVSHENVVQVYDVGEDDESVYISMELIPGVDLLQWLEQGPHPWRTILDMLMAAGRGLVAAHARGMVHRDFKPSNVLVGEDGRPRVVDFGLACVTEDVTTRTGQDLTATISFSGPRPLTKTGVTLGTPAYMAPEQHRGEAADARTDQYAFCASVFEGLYGMRPFRGSTVQELVDAKERHVLPVPQGHSVPARVWPVLERGLHPDRNERWPSMAALLSALERATGPRLRPEWRVGALVIGAGGIAAALAVASLDDRTTAPAGCPPAAERLAGVWDAEREATLRDTVERSGLAYADETWSRLDERLDGYARRWGDAYDRVCTDIHDSPVDQAALDRRMVCLGVRRDELSSLVEVLASGQGDAILHAIEAVTDLRPVADCEEATPLENPDGIRLAAAQDARRALLRAESLGKVARFDEGLALAESTLERVTTLDLPPLRAQALYVSGQMYKGKGEAERAHQRLSEGVMLAASIGRDDLAARTAIALVDVRGAWQSHYDEALEWNRHAQASIERLGDAPALEAERLAALGNLELTRGHFDEAIAAFERALELDRQTFGAGHPRLAAAQSNLSGALVRAGRFDEGLEAARQALAAGQQAFGPTHPGVGIMHSRLANAWVRQGNYERSIEHSEQALRILEATLGPDHPNVSVIVVGLAQVQQRLGHLDQADAIYRRALGGVSGTPNEAIVLTALDELARERNDYPEALRYARRSRELRETLYGPKDSKFIIGLIYEGLALAQVGRDPEAEATFDRIRQLTEVQALPVPIQVLLSAYEGRAHLHAGRLRPAIDGLRHALALQEQLGSEPIDRADVRFHLVKALWSLGQHDDARSELAVVDQELSALGAQAEYRRQPIRQWIDQQKVGYVLESAKG